MKKILILFCFFFMIIAENPAFADIIYCPRNAKCENGICRLDSLGTPWTDSDASGIRDGVFPFTGASENAGGGNDNITYCFYHVTPETPGGSSRNMFFVAHNHPYRAAINAIGNRWTTSSMNHGCYSVNGPQDCPFTSVPIVK